MSSSLGCAPSSSGAGSPSPCGEGNAVSLWGGALHRLARLERHGLAGAGATSTSICSAGTLRRRLVEQARRGLWRLAWHRLGRQTLLRRPARRASHQVAQPPPLAARAVSAVSFSFLFSLFSLLLFGRWQFTKQRDDHFFIPQPPDRRQSCRSLRDAAPGAA